MGLLEKTTRGVGWSALGSWGGQAVNFVVFMVLARLLTPEMFGVVAIANVFVGLVRVLVDQGFADAIVQRNELEDEHLDTAFWTNMALGSLLCAGGLFGADFIARMFEEEGLGPVLQALSFILVFAALDKVQAALFRRRLDFRVLTLRNLSAILAGGIAGVGMAYYGWGVWSLVGQQMVRSGVGVVLIWLASDWRPGFGFSTSHFSDLFSFGISVVGGNLLTFANRRVDDFLIGAFLGSTALGYYSVAYKLIMTAIKLLNGISQNVLFSAFSRIQTQHELLRKAFYKATRYTSLVAFPAFTGLAVIAGDIIPVVFGSQWTDSVPVVQLLAFVGMLRAVYNFNMSVILAKGKSSWRLGMNALYAFGNVIAFTIAAQWGIVAVAAAIVATDYLLSPVPLWAIKKLVDIDIKEYVTQYLVPLTGVLGMVVTLLLLRSATEIAGPSAYKVATQVVIGATMYIAVILAVDSSLWTDIKQIVKALRPTT